MPIAEYVPDFHKVTITIPQAVSPILVGDARFLHTSPYPSSLLPHLLFCSLPSSIARSLHFVSLIKYQGELLLAKEQAQFFGISLYFIMDVKFCINPPNLVNIADALPVQYSLSMSDKLTLCPPYLLI